MSRSASATDSGTHESKVLEDCHSYEFSSGMGVYDVPRRQQPEMFSMRPIKLPAQPRYQVNERLDKESCLDFDEIDPWVKEYLEKMRHDPYAVDVEEVEDEVESDSEFSFIVRSVLAFCDIFWITGVVKKIWNLRIT